MGDNTRPGDVNNRPVTNVISGGVIHGPVIQTGSFEGDIHVHAPPEQSAERDSALAELEQRLEAQERAEREERQRRAEEQRETEWRRERERQNQRRNRRIEIRMQVREERADRVRSRLAVMFCALGLVLFVVGFSTGHRFFMPFLGLFLCLGGIPLARAIPTSVLEGLSNKDRRLRGSP
ncbi:hypothetical protein ABZ553_32905 [Streptomyces sparsogenes]|uniref:hypothetical protein n=1 Tax=Streptomyces sparsogenes TaxID=67365 RepID=UPI0033D6CD35